MNYINWNVKSWGRYYIDPFYDVAYSLRLIGNCLTRNRQIDLTGCRSSLGIYAPTLRFHKRLVQMFREAPAVSGKPTLILAKARGVHSPKMSLHGIIMSRVMSNWRLHLRNSVLLLINCGMKGWCKSNEQYTE